MSAPQHHSYGSQHVCCRKDSESSKDRCRGPQAKTDDEVHSCQEHRPADGRVLDDKTMLCFTWQTLSIIGLLGDGLSESQDTPCVLGRSWGSVYMGVTAGVAENRTFLHCRVCSVNVALSNPSALQSEPHFRSYRRLWKIWKQAQGLCWGLSVGSSGATRVETVNNGNNH